MNDFLRLFRNLILSGSNDNLIKLLVSLGHFKQLKLDDFNSFYIFNQRLPIHDLFTSDNVSMTFQPIDDNINEIFLNCSHQFKSHIDDFLGHSLQELIIGDGSFRYLSRDIKRGFDRASHGHGMYSQRKRDHNLLLSTMLVLSLKGVLSRTNPYSTTQRGSPFNSITMRFELSRTTTPLLIALIISLTAQLSTPASNKPSRNLNSKSTIKKFIKLLIEFIDEDCISFAPEYFTTDLF